MSEVLDRIRRERKQSQAAYEAAQRRGSSNVLTQKQVDNAVQQTLTEKATGGIYNNPARRDSRIRNSVDTSSYDQQIAEKRTQLDRTPASYDLNDSTRYNLKQEILELEKQKEAFTKREYERLKTEDWEKRQAAAIKNTGNAELLADLKKLNDLEALVKANQNMALMTGGTPQITQTEKDYWALQKRLSEQYGENLSAWKDYAARAENQEQAAKTEQELAEAAKENPFWWSLGTVPLNMASGLGFVDVAGQRLKQAVTGSETPIDYNTVAMLPSKSTNAIRGSVSEKIEEDTAGKIGSDTALGNLYSGAYNLGMSMADSAAGMLTGGNTLLLAGGAATNAMNEAISRGATTDQALMIGLTAGAMESVMEKLSIDSLFNMTSPKTVKQLVLNILKQGGAEATEETLTNIANTVADAIIMGDKSQIQTDVRRYMESGYTREQAEKKALSDWGTRLLGDAIGGFASGSAFGGVRGTASYLSNKNAAAPTQTQVDKAIQETLGQNNYMSKNGHKKTGAEQLTDVSNDTPVFTPESGSAQTPNNSIPGNARNVNGVGDMGAKPAMGAADYGFDPISNASNKYGAIPPGEKAARVVDLPVSMDGKTKVSQFARTGAESAVAGEDGAQRILDLVAENKLSHEVFTDDAALEAAGKEIADAYRNGNVYNVYTRFLQDVAEGKVGKDLMATGSILFADASTAKDHESAAELFIALTELQKRGGQAVQAARMLKKLSPEGRVWVMRKTVEKINRGISAEGKKGAGLNKVSTKTKNEVAQVVGEERDKVLRQLAGKENKERDHGLAVEDWTQEIGNEVAKALGEKPAEAKPKPISRTIKQDILRFVDKKYQPQRATQKRTMLDTLTDYFANRAEYDRAWNAAKETYGATYDSNPDGFAGADTMLGGTGSDAVVGRVIVEEIVEQDLKQKNIDARMFLGDQANLEDQIANSIIQKTGATGEDQTFIRQSVNWYLENKFDPKKTTGSIDHAIKETLSNKAINDAKLKISDIIRYSPSDKAVIANKVAAMLVQDYGVSKEGAQTAAANIVKRFNDMIAESTEKRLASMFKKRSYEQKTVQQRFRELANMGAFSGSDYADQVTEKLFGSAVHIDNDLLNEYMNATGSDAIREVEDKIYESIGKQIPSDFKTRWNTWRYMSMLGTFKGPERNFIGNTAGAVMRVSKNLPAAIGEAWLERMGKIGKGDRTKTIVPAGKELKQAAKDDIKNVKNELKGIGKHHIVNDKIQESRQIFNFAPAEKLRKGIDTLMSDNVFSNDAYVSSLANFLKARGYTAEDFKGNGMTEAQKAEARDYAVSEALKATYRDLNWLSDTITSMRFNPKTAKTPGGAKARAVANAALEGIQPFLKTPANILARGIEYDPVLGTISTIVKASKAKKRGDYKATEMLDDVGKVLTGTAIATIGYFMKEHDMIVARSDDEEQDDLEGRQEYSLVINGKYIPIDWMAPFCMPLFVGVELHDLLYSASDNGAPLTSKIGNSLNSITSALFQTSMLEGLQSTIDNVKYADNAPIALVANATLGYLGQAVPTIFGQIERMLNPYQEMTFVDKSNKWLDADWQRALGTQSRKIPFFDYNQIPYIDAWGRKIETGGIGKRALNNLFNPANVSEERETNVDIELKRLEQETGNGDLTPSRAQSVLTIDGEQVILTADEYLTYAQAKGQNDFTFRESVMASEAYAALDSNIQWRVHKLSEELANDLAINEIGIKKENMSDWHKELIGADIETITQTLIERAVESEAKNIGENKYDGISGLLDSGTINDTVALAIMSDSAVDGYMDYCKKAGVSVADYADVYAYMNKTDDKEKTLEYIEGLNMSKAKKVAIAQGIYGANPTFIPVDSNVPKNWLLEMGATDEIVDQFSENQTELYNTYIRDTGVDMGDYLEIWAFKNSAKSDKDANGKVTYSAKDKTIDEIDKLNVSNDVKRNLFLGVGYSAKNIPWWWK